MNVMDRPKRPAPPKSTERKASPVNKAFEEKAQTLLRAAIKERGVTIDELTRKLAGIGVEMSSGGVANKISRGGFSAAFLMQCMEALEIEINIDARSSDD